MPSPALFLRFQSNLDSIHNSGHNILELYSVLAQVRFTTSKTKQNLISSAVSLLHELPTNIRLKIKKIRKYYKNPNQGGDITQRTVPLPEIKLQQQQQKVRINRQQNMLVLHSFTGFLYSAPKHLPENASGCPQMDMDGCRLARASFQLDSDWLWVVLSGGGTFRVTEDSFG